MSAKVTITNARTLQERIDELGAGPPDPWRKLIAALVKLDSWAGDHPGTSAFVGVTNDGDFYGNVHVEAELMDEYEDTQVDGKTVDEVIAGLIVAIDTHIERREREAKELAEE